MLPVTFGSCLQLTKGVVAFRDLPPIQIRLRAWNVEDILELLKEGKDVKLITHRQCERYRQYYWYRMTKKESVNIIDIEQQKIDAMGIDMDIAAFSSQ